MKTPIINEVLKKIKTWVDHKSNSETILADQGHQYTSEEFNQYVTKQK